MRVRLRATKNDRQGETRGAEDEAPQAVEPAPGPLDQSISQRRFLKLLGTATGLAALAAAGHVAVAPRQAEAADATYDTLTINTALKAGTGNLIPVQNNAGTSFVTFDGANQRLGIGTAAPGAKFEISAPGGWQPNFILSGSGEQTFRFYNTSSLGSTRVSWKMADRVNTDWRWIMYTDIAGNGEESFTIRGVAAGHVFYANENGWVGIGTTAPQGKLDVAGDIRVSGVVDIGTDGVAKQAYYAP